MDTKSAARAWALMSMASEQIGVYPQSMKKNGVETKRTEWQDGWNAAVIAIVEAQEKIEEYINLLSETDADKLICLSEKSIIFFNIDEKEESVMSAVRFAVNCGDVFYDCCADCEQAEPNEIASIWAECFDENGNEKNYGRAIWCIEKRKQKPTKYYCERLKKAGVWRDAWEDYK